MSQIRLPKYFQAFSNALMSAALSTILLAGLFSWLFILPNENRFANLPLEETEKSRFHSPQFLDRYTENDKHSNASNRNILAAHEIALVKILNTASPVSVGSPVSFTIRVTNTGAVAITTLPLTETYDVNYLTYDPIINSAGPNPATDPINDGQVTWNNIIDFDGDNQLGPNEALDLVVTYIAKEETVNLQGGLECEGTGQTYSVVTASDVDFCVAVTIDPPEPKLTLGDVVYHDINGDGAQANDGSELGIDGVLVYLWELDGTGNRIVTSLVTATTTTTNAVSGFYQFEVPSGEDFEIEIADINFDPGGPLYGYVFSNDQTANPVGSSEQVLQALNVTSNDDTLDFALYCEFDLALDKKLAPGQPAIITPSDDVTFTITIYNQGAVTATNVLVADYIPNGFTLSAAETDWNGGPGGTITTTVSAALTPSGTVGSSATVELILTAGAALSGTYTNTAEIADFVSIIKDGNGNNLPDADSTPDTTEGNGPGESTALVDNEINQDGTNGGDEDDHDLAAVTVQPDPPAVGRITIIKDAVPDDEQDFTFTATALPSTTFTLDDDTDGTLSNQIVFSDLPVGTYTITEELVTDWFLSSLALRGGIGGNTSISAANRRAVVNLDDGENITLIFTNTLQVAPQPEVSIGNQVWNDGNNNGLYDVGEDIVPNLPIELWLDVDDDGIAEPLGDDGLTAQMTMTTNASGQYSFTNLAPGNYFVRIPAPPPETPLSSIPLSEPDNGFDNDDNGDQPGGANTQILSPVINLTVGQEPGTTGGGNYDYAVDFGLVDPFIGNLIWHDQNNNGLVDMGEPGIPGVTVTVLYDANGNGSIEVNERTPFRTTQSDSNGIYVFPDLLPDSNYQVVIPIENFQVGGALENLPYSSDTTSTADNQIDEDDNGIQVSPGVTVTSPIVRLEVDAEPVDGNGANDESGRGAHLDNGDDNNGDLTIDFGFYSVASLPSIVINKMINGAGPFIVGQAISYTIRITNTGSVTITTLPLTDTFDATYLAYNAVTDLIGPNPATTISSNVIYWADATDYDMDSDGQLAPNEILDIIVVFDAIAATTNAPATECAPAGSTYNKATALGMNACIGGPFGPPEAKLALDGVIWHDINNDGAQDANEPGIDGVVVNLYEMTNGNTFVISTTTTTSNTVSGFYQFDVSDGNTYQVEIDASNFVTGGPLEGFVIANNQNDITGATVATRIAPVNGTNVTNQDFGYYCRFDLALDKKLAQGQPANIAPGDDVTFTLTLYNQGVVTATNVTVADYIPAGFTLNDGNWNGGATGTVTQTLSATLTPSGTQNASTTVDIVLTAGPTLSGTYTNTGEIANYISSVTDANGTHLPDADSTPDSDGNNGTGETTALVDDELNEDGKSGGDEDDHDPATVTVIDTPVNPSIAVDKQFNGVGDYRVGETISFTIRITNTGDVIIDTLPLEDRYSSAFITYQSANPAPDSTTLGILSWDDLLVSLNDVDGLGLNESVSVVVTFTTAADTTLLPAVSPCTTSGHAPNLARSVGVMAGTSVVIEDADDTSCDSVEILNPTAVQLAKRSVNQTPDGVLVYWQLAEETDVAGFNILYANGITSEKRNDEMISADNLTNAAGQTSRIGYSWLDAGAKLQQGDIYVLEIVKQNGLTERAVIDVVSNGNIFLPFVIK
ncbi:MAG: SdrD B-like domain-containing protein [Chloroflexota bacterium]